MSTFRNPVGPESPNVYWRRRLVVGIVVVVVIVVILLIVFAHRGGGKPTASNSLTPGSSSAPSSTPSSSGTAAPPACTAGRVTVTASLDKTVYKAGESPQLSFSIKNDSSAACTMSAGSDVQDFTITSGKDTIWSSKDCQSGAQPASVVIQPGESAQGGPLAWDRTRSSKTTCTASRPQVAAGGASYHLTVTVNGIKSADKQFILS